MILANRIRHDVLRSRAVNRICEIATLAAITACLPVSSAKGGLVAITPIGPTSVAPGEPVVFELALSVESLSEFDAADVFIGTNAGALQFTYSQEWLNTLDYVTPVTEIMEIYEQGLFLGGNHAEPVGTDVLLGTLVIATDNLELGEYYVTVDSALDDGLSGLTLAGSTESLAGTGTFTVGCEDGSACDDVNVCTFDRCEDSVCTHGDRRWGDLVNANGTCGPDGIIDIADIFAVLDGFQNIFNPDCGLQSIDISGETRCWPDGMIDISDIFAVLDSFQGDTSCCP